MSRCPVSHQYLPLGIMRLRSLRDSGALVGLGTDGPAAGHRQDMFECMKLGILLQRAHTLNPLVSNAHEALEMATKAAADYMEIDASESSLTDSIQAFDDQQVPL